MKKIIGLYGDSYVDPACATYMDAETTTYATMLSENYTVENYGLAGTGPEYSIEMLDQHGADNDIIIFFTGFPDRLPFHKIPHPGHSVDLSDIYYRENGSRGKIKRDRPGEFQDYNKENYDHIRFMYKSLGDHILKKTEYILGYLKNYSDINNTKVIAIIQDTPRSYNPESPTIIPQEIRSALQTKNFIIYPENIASVSRTEFVHFSHVQDNKNDIRVNHLTQANHNVLYNNIISILEQEPNYPSQTVPHINRILLNNTHTYVDDVPFIYDT